jgi:phospholipid/cholesterol/gamma-HCH transport system permease protein
VSTQAAGRAALPAPYLYNLRRLTRALQQPFEKIGQWLLFTGQVICYLPLTIRRYGKESLARMNNLAWGRGSLLADGGVISVLVILGIAVGASIAIEAFATLNMLGFGALSGIVGGLANVREFSPLVAGIAFAAQVGCRMTAEIGSMRIAEEIDAIEAMGLRPIPFVVGTRFVGGMVIVVPGFLFTLLVSFFISNTMIKVVYGQPGGTYDHYFVQFMSPTDLAYSLLKASLFCAAVIVVHCYYGYFASGGPAGVGLASGRAVRASLVAIMTLDFIMTVALWGLSPTFVFKG